MYPRFPTLIEGVLARLHEEPAAEALRDDAGSTTRGELSAASGRLAFALLQSGVRSGDRMVLALAPGRRFVTTLLAALRLGVIVVPIHRKAKLRELQHVLWDAGPRVACADEPLADLVRTAAPALRLLDPEALLGRPLEDAGVDLSHDHAGVTASERDDALLLYTSGTTGRPKGAVHTQGSLAANVAALEQAWRLAPGDRLLHCLPLHHLHGLVVGLLASLWSGVTVELADGFEAAGLLERLATTRATLFYGVPAMYSRLVDDAPKTALPAMRLFVSGSAPLPAALKREFERRFGFVILERYGATETGIALSQDVEGPRPTGSVGRPLPGVKTNLVAPDGNEASDEGELLVAGPSLFRGYYEDDDATRAVLVDGWYRTGDLVRRAPDGTITILGRLSTDMIKVNGHRVGALEIEAALAEHAAVAEVAVVGAPDPRSGEIPVAFVRRRDASLDESTLLAHARALLAPHQVPGRVHFVEDFPRTGPGKIDRASLRSRV